MTFFHFVYFKLQIEGTFKKLETAHNDFTEDLISLREIEEVSTSPHGGFVRILEDLVHINSQLKKVTTSKKMKQKEKKLESDNLLLTPQEQIVQNVMVI